MNLQKKLFIISSVLVLAGLVGLLPYAYFYNQQQTALANSPVITLPVIAPVPEPSPDLITGKPVHITLPDAMIDLSVTDGIYDSVKQTWTLTHDKAQYALMTTQPNNKSGNTLIYGHAEKQVFARLNKLKPGDQAFITTDNGYRFVYTYRETAAVDPSNVDILAYTGKPQLTLQTCSGSWWQNRQFYFFNLDSVAKI